jgi:hypothetical protein
MVKKQLDHPIREIHTLPNFDPEQNWNLIQNLMVFAPVSSHIWSPISLETRGLIYKK